MTKNGFQYYLPKQYHEEETKDLNDRIGSFGYIDPFGIRRVIYYNTAPGEGFQIRKNNRYVGHDATPYDPRPINWYRSCINFCCDIIKLPLNLIISIVSSPILNELDEEET